MKRSMRPSLVAYWHLLLLGMTLTFACLFAATRLPTEAWSAPKVIIL